MKLLEKYYQVITKNIHAQILADLLPMEVTPAARWFLQESDKEHWNYTDDFPCVVPPSPVTWLEFQAPDYIASAEKYVENKELNRLGALCLTLEVEPEARDLTLRQDLLLRYMQALSGEAVPPAWTGERAQRGQHQATALTQGTLPRWLTIWNLVAEPFSGSLLPFGLYGMYLDESGRIIPGCNAAISGFPASFLEQMPPDYDIFADALPFMFALSLTHCKNVAMSDVVVPPALAKKRAKKGLPSFTFKVLDIKPIRKQSAASGQGGSDAKRAMHIVRGHFKEFSADKPLFGKHSGTYWWGLSVRGASDSGAAAKSYRVQAP